MRSVQNSESFIFEYKNPSDHLKIFGDKLNRFIDGNKLEISLKKIEAIETNEDERRKLRESIRNVTKITANPSHINEVKLSCMNSLVAIDLRANPNIKIISLSFLDSIKDQGNLQFPDEVREIEMNLINLPSFPKLTDKIEKLGVFHDFKRDIFSKLQIKSLPPKLNSLVFRVNSKVEIDKDLDLSSSLRGLKNLKFDSFVVSSQPKLPDSLESLSYEDAIVKDLNNSEFPPNLSEFVIEGRKDNPSPISEITKPFPKGLNKLHLKNLSNLTKIPEFPEEIISLNLSGCDKLESSLEIVSSIEKMAQKNADFECDLPEQIFRSSKIFQIKNNIFDAHLNHNLLNKDEDKHIIDKDFCATIKLVERYAHESFRAFSLNCRTPDGEKDRKNYEFLVDEALRFSEFLKSNPHFLHDIEDISSQYLEACVNQPVRGFIEIANMAKIAQEPNFEIQVEMLKTFLSVLEVVDENIKKIGESLSESNKEIFDRNQFELFNCLAKEVNKKLYKDQKIKHPLVGFPEKICFSANIQQYIDPNVEKIADEVCDAIAQKTQNSHQYLCDIIDNQCLLSYHGLVLSITLGDEYREHVQKVAESKSQYIKGQLDEESQAKNLQEQEQELEKLKQKCKISKRPRSDSLRMTEAQNLVLFKMRRIS